MAIPQPGAVNGRAGQVISTVRGGQVYAPHQSRNTTTVCPDSIQPHIQITLQGFDVGGGLCSSGLLGHVVSSLAPLLGGPVCWVLGGVLGFLQA